MKIDFENEDDRKFIMDRVNGFSRLSDEISEQKELIKELMAEKEALIKAHVEGHFEWCNGCGTTSEILRAEFLQESKMYIDRKSVV